MNYVKNLEKRAKEVKSIVCMGMDPVLDKIPINGDVRYVLEKFYLDMLREMQKQNVFPAIIKPNIAFFEQYGFEALNALKTIINQYHLSNIPVILDAKRGDIGKTSMAYAKNLFEFWNADATTIAPYMGSDSVGPFIDWGKKGKGIYILCRTSNEGSKDLQDLKIGKTPLYMKVAEKIVDWYEVGTGAVIGATYPKELKEISDFFVKSGKVIPLLIPGVGAQGGSAKEVLKALKESGNNPLIHRINSSSAINFAFIKKDSPDFAKCAVDALKELNLETWPL